MLKLIIRFNLAMYLPIVPTVYPKIGLKVNLVCPFGLLAHSKAVDPPFSVLKASYTYL